MVLNLTQHTLTYNMIVSGTLSAVQMADVQFLYHCAKYATITLLYSNRLQQHHKYSCLIELSHIKAGEWSNDSPSLI